MDISILFEEMIDLISFFLYKRKKAASSYHNFAGENNKEVWLRGLKLRLSESHKSLPSSLATRHSSSELDSALAARSVRIRFLTQKNLRFSMAGIGGFLYEIENGCQSGL